jgi:hypothetical protein
LDWFKSLRQILFDQHHITLEEEISTFVNIFTDFRHYNYDVHLIVKEYQQIESIRNEVRLLQGIVESIKKTRDNLLEEVESLEKRERYSSQALNALQELKDVGFELKELKKLKDVVVEICNANDIEMNEAGKKFLKDVENQYDNKLGFEAKINELNTVLKKLENEKPAFKEYLQSKDIVNRSLPLLYRFGVTDDDIINMADVIIDCLNGNIIFNPDLQSEKIVEENRPVRRSQYWKLFIHAIRNLGDINSQIMNKRFNLKALNKEIETLNIQRQKINEQTLLSGQLLNSLNGQLSGFLEFLKQIMSSAKYLNTIYIVYRETFIVFITKNNNSKNGNEHKDE